MIEITIDTSRLEATLDRLVAAVADASPVMREISDIMWDAVEENFAQQGRPRWLGLKPSTLQQRVGGQLGKGRGVLKSGAWSLQIGQRVARSLKILQASGRLASSITPAYDATSARVGTNVVYAAIHQFGGQTRAHVIRPKNAKALHFGGIFAKQVNHPGSKIPARPFLAITPSDGVAIEEAMANYLRNVVG
ncbi:phage virion morphogenesis protein [Paraburkholderia unamae]|uniref:Phage gpG-like protein n=1 Tax=Paraburkholderia unamae TaxID=219649 RepID=A0ABX5KNR3_9BURK|nr:phage virion morphogenesis protein [Paraburkholderia unamae]PVX80045.1 phage gpG-like protein [Paraburkholderia unamae]